MIITNDRNFSNQHRSQLFEPHWYGEAFLWISHVSFLSKSSSFKFHTCFDNSFMHSWCHAKRFCMVVIPCFELPFSFRSSIVNKAVVGCCRYSFVYYTLSETLTIHWAIWFWPATTFAVIVVICFTQTLELCYLMMFPTLAVQQ